MRRLVSPMFFAAASTACLSALAWPSAASAAAGPLEHCVATWMGVVAVIGADEDAGEEEPFAGPAAQQTFEIDEADADDGPPRERRRRDGHPHGPPHHHGMGPERMGPDAHRAAMRAFHEIIRRLGRIERQLGVESGPPSGPEGEWSRRPRPEKVRSRGPGDSAERPEIPDDVRRRMEERMQEGRRRMDEAKERMEEARRKFRDMEERIKQLEAEVARLKGGQ